MRIAFPNSFSPAHYDPAHITLSPEYIFLENTFSPLIEMGKHGTVTHGVASVFEWVGDEAVFTIRDDLYTIDGYKISALDAEASLKRLLVLTGNTHGNIQDLLCGPKKLRSLQDECPGIEVRGNQLILKPGQRKQFLFHMLTAIDFAVIPCPSMDSNTLAITDFRNTTGPYYVERDEGMGNIVLKENTRHYHFSDRIAEEIRLVPMDKSSPNSSLQALDSGAVDVVTTIDASTPESSLQFHKQNQSRFNLHASIDIRNLVLTFTPGGLQTFSRDQRLWIGKKVREGFTKYAEGSLAYKPAKQFFPTFGEGGLSDEQMTSLNQAFDTVPEFNLSGEGLTVPLIRLALRAELQDILQDALPGIKVVDGQSPAFADYSQNPDEMPLFELSGPDIGILEDITLISYSMAAGFLAVPKSSREKWLDDYGAIEKKEERIARLNELHFKSLMDPLVVPIAMAPYVALSTKDWDIGLSNLYANCQFWMLTRK